MRNKAGIYRCFSGVVLMFLNIVVIVHAEELDGAQILHLEADRARELQTLEHEAQVLEQQARIAVARKRLQDAGIMATTIPMASGFMSGEPLAGAEHIGEREPVDHDLHRRVMEKLPTLQSIVGDKAYLSTVSGLLVVSRGDTLPGQYRVRQIDANTGVSLEKNGLVYQIEVDWK